MDPYKASRNENIEEDLTADVPEKSQKEIDFEKNKNTTEKLAQGVGMYFGGSVGGEAVKLASQTKMGQMVTDQVASKITDNKVLNKVSTKLNDSGVVDAAGQAMDLMSDGGATSSLTSGASSATNAATNSGAAENLAKSASTSSTSNSIDSLNSTSNSNNSMLSTSDNSNKKSSSSLNELASIASGAKTKKLILFGGAAFILVIFFFIIGAVSQKDFFNLALTNNTVLASTNKGNKLCTPTEIENKIIYVGDSRMEGMSSALTGSTATFIAKSSQGYTWLTETASGELDSKLSENSNAIVVINLGVNDIYNVDNYISYYNELFSKYPSVKFYILSVNPVEESKAAANGYVQTNSAIEEFNSKMQSSFSSNYLDSYNSIKSNFSTTDGIHYTNETYKAINDFVLSNISSSGSVYCGSSSANVMGQLEEVGRWYIENVNTYQNSTSGSGTGSRKYYQTPFGTRQFGDDCTEFVTAYMSYVCGQDLPESYSGDMVYPDGSWAQEVAQCNWKAYSSDEVGTLQPGDVLIAHSGALYSTKGQHAEVYISETETFGWGSIKSKYPTSNTISTETDGSGHVHFKDGGHDYVTVYRYEGVTESSDPLQSESGINTTTPDLKITKMGDSSFNHGTKTRSNQKYIVLHDTEMKEDAVGVVNAWKNSNNGVASHFVVDRDGSIIQAVELDIITHHAGWGGPGDFDSKFGVGNNDGLGNGDDLIGTTKEGYASYTSYGMNSYSVGIEMCHENGEDYTEAQLTAVDKLISYIDSYFGFQSQIIDHKDWRPSNSDTDVKFSEYLNNYKTLRHH